MHGHQGFQTRQNQAEFFGENIKSDRHSLTSEGLYIPESQQGNAQEQSPVSTRKSERFETAEAPINFDFLGGHQQLMRGQQSGMPLPRPREQSGFVDMELWKQHMMFKQLQELQRQQQLQQLDEARQKNSLSQLSTIAKQADGDQFPSPINGTPIHDASNYSWPTELMGGDSKVPSTSQMFMVGNMNWVQRGASPAVHGFPDRLMFSHEQGQALRMMGIVPQQLDQSLYGAPVASTRGSLSQYSHLQGISHDPTNLLSKTGSNQVEKPIMQSSAFTNSFQGDQGAVFSDQVSMQDGVSVSRQGLQGRNFLGHAPVQGSNSGVLSENLQQVNTLPKNAQVQEFHGRQERAGWSGNLQEKTAMQVAPSQGLVALDPTEEKILFNTDDSIWAAPFGRSTNMRTGGYGNTLEGTDDLNAFPSIQSGSWSALMQSAVAEASSSDTGLQEEWSGLSFQKTELSTGIQPAAFDDSAKQQTTWVDNNLQTASSLSSRHFPLFGDANMGPSGCSIPGFQQSGIKFSHEQSERVQPDSSHKSIQQSPKEASKWLDRSPQQMPLVEGSQQVRPPMHLENASDCAWAGHNYEQSESAAHSADAELNAQPFPGSLAHQPSISSYNVGRQPCSKPNGWNFNDSLSPGEDATLNIHENESTVQQFQSNDHKRAMHRERDHDGGMWKADGNHVAVSFPQTTGGLDQAKFGTGSPRVNREDPCVNNFSVIPNLSTTNVNQETNQQFPNNHQLDYRKHVDSSVNYEGHENMGQYQHQPSKGPRFLESSMSYSDKGTGEIYEQKQDNCHQNENSDSYNSNSSNHTVTGGGVRENVWLNASDSRPSAGGNKKSSGQIGRKVSGSRKFQYHPMGNLGLNVELDSRKHITHPQALFQPVTRGLKSHEQGYLGQSKYVGHVPNSAMDMEKGHLPVFQGNTKGSEVPSRGIHPHSESNISASFDRSVGVYPPIRTAQTSQNMLELLHKVDQSKECSAETHFGSSDRNLSSDMPEAETPNASAAHLQRNPSPASQGFGLRLAPPSQRPPSSNLAFSSHNSSQRVNDLNSRHVDPEIAEKGQIWLAPTDSLQSLPPSHEMSHREWDNKSSISEQTGNETSHLDMHGNSSAAFTSGLPYLRNQLQNQHMSSASGQVTTDQSVNISFDRFASHFKQTNASHDGAGADQSAKASLSGKGSRIPPFNLAPPADTSQSVSTNPSYLRVSGQQFPVLESVPVSQLSVTSGVTQQGAFSTMLHNVWTNVSTQQSLSGVQPHKVPPNMFQSMNSSNNNLETVSWAPQTDVQDIKKGRNGPSEFGACSVNLQGFAYGEEQPGKESSWQQIPSENFDPAPHTEGASQGQESVAKHRLDANFSAAGSLVARPHQQDLDRGSNGKDPSLVPQTEHSSLQNPAASRRDIEAFGRYLKPSHVLHQNYSLLHQVQDMKSVETDPSRRGLQIYKRTDCGPNDQQVATEAGQQLLDGYNAMVQDAVDNELNVTVRRTSFLSRDPKMLSFSSEAREDQNTNASSQLVPGDVPSRDMVAFGQNYSQNHSRNNSIASVGAEHSQISLQIAPSWFEQYGAFNNGQMPPMYDARSTAKTATQQFIFGKPSESVHTHTSTEQLNAVDACQVGSVWQSTTTTLVASENLSPPNSLPPYVTDQSLVVVRTKKRKSATSELLPWHKEVTQGSQRFQNISMAELEWAQASSRLIEKVEDEVEMIEDGQPMFRPKRRLILTTKLMQQLLRPAPAAILSAEATSDYEGATYFVAKLALGDACSMISCSGSDSCVPPDNGNTTSEKLKTSERIGDQYFSKVVEGFIDRARKLENDLLRLDKRASILDIRVECQDLERFSIINRFAKFHGRGQADRVETLSSSDAAAIAQKTCPRRYVTALPMPRNLPKGVQCLSL